MAKEQLLGTRGHKLQNAHDAVEFLKERFAFGKETAPGHFQEVRLCLSLMLTIHGWQDLLSSKHRFLIPGTSLAICFILQVRRHHWEIKVGEVNRRRAWDCAPIPGSRSLHCFVGPKEDRPTLLRVRELCCFCPSCVDEDESVPCPSAEWAGQWTVEEIHPKVPSDVSENIQNMGTGTGINDWEDDELDLADCIQVSSGNYLGCCI